MLQAKIMTVDSMRNRLELRMTGKNKVTTSQRANSNRLNEVLMAKHNVTLNYLKGLQAFQDRLTEDQTLRLVEEGKENAFAVIVTTESGRRYDKVHVGLLNSDMEQVEKSTVRYFVERATGNIYGAKSELAPNTKWFFGTLDSTSQWDWAGHHGTPKDLAKAGVREVGGYGQYKHYEPAEHTEKASKVA